MTNHATSVVTDTRADVLPGFILSKPRWTDLADLENTFNSLYTVGMLRPAEALPSAAFRIVAEVVAEKIRQREWAYGKPGFDQAIFMWPVFPMLLWMSLRVRHGQVTLERAKAMIEEMSEDHKVEVRRAILEMLHYDFGGSKPKAGDGSGDPLNYRQIYKTLREKRGLQPSEILNLTFDQVLAELGVNPEEAELREAVDRRQRARDRETLVRAAERMGVPLDVLKVEPLEMVVAAVSEVTGSPADPAQVRRAIDELLTG